ncbi:PepSY-associated TM helix domain-containing protein [Rhodocyclus gracilis]|uniref:PepSY domain-containing protein n=1 Tax=Rhodocyclus tenuis TaxID=1066 RepID=A0A6L5JTD5_RHOTE|nr:PepSY-associated TM helix domain-containing protein [Rhodocyclus gracilis]MQY50653.1 PepSY domain-containing protein [Rhodocyclus gracilis]
MRQGLVVLHRYCGLACALFLTVAGLTGAIIAWDHEIDAWLNPQFFQAAKSDATLPPLLLAERLEAAEPRLRVRYLPLTLEAGEALQLFVEPRTSGAGSGSGATFDYNQVAIDPATGDVQARREWGKPTLERENLLPFLYKLHYSLHLPDAFGLSLGTLFMGGIAIVWCFDTLLALWISFPSRRNWRQSFAFRWRAGGYRRQFDLHRSGGVWLFPLLITLAVTSVSMNLRDEVMRPLVSWFSPLTPAPASLRVPPAITDEPHRDIGMRAVLDIARREALARGITAPAGGIYHDQQQNVYGVGFFAAGASHGDGGLGNPWLSFDAASGQFLGADIPGTGTPGDIFMQAMFPLHSGRIAGVPGRALISASGLLIAGLCLTGLVIWAKKRRARHLSGRERASLVRPLGKPRGV